jgi:hypothetical protein
MNLFEWPDIAPMLVTLQIIFWAIAARLDVHAYKIQLRDNNPGWSYSKKTILLLVKVAINFFSWPVTLSLYYFKGVGKPK